MSDRAGTLTRRRARDEAGHCYGGPYAAAAACGTAGRLEEIQQIDYGKRPRVRSDGDRVFVAAMTRTSISCRMSRTGANLTVRERAKIRCRSEVGARRARRGRSFRPPLLEPRRRDGDGAGERAALVAEEARSRERPRRGTRAIEDERRFVRAVGRRRVNDSRDEILAGAALALTSTVKSVGDTR